jgi:hypothetical protein
LHIDKLGNNDNIGERTQEQRNIAAEAIASKTNEEGYDTLNNRASTTDQEVVKPMTSTDDLERAKASTTDVHVPKRNLFVQFKAFPNLERLKTNTIW